LSELIPSVETFDVFRNAIREQGSKPLYIFTYPIRLSSKGCAASHFPVLSRSTKAILILLIRALIKLLIFSQR
jgi:hypothetical protein